MLTQFEASAAPQSRLVSVEDLYVALPNGTPILEHTNFELRAGEVVSLLGPSGAGKSTLLKAIFWPEQLASIGYTVACRNKLVQGRPAFVPQRGALLDHLDVAQNIELAQAASNQAPNALPWLTSVGLQPEFGARGRPVSSLSGGQAQRVAVARVLAASRQLIVLDEPSVGLDPVGVRQLARLLVLQARQLGVAIIVITHDLALAGGASDRLLFLDPALRTVVPVLHGWRGPCEADDASVRQRRLAELEDAVESMLLTERPNLGGARGNVKVPTDFLGPVRTAGAAIQEIFRPALARESTVVLRRNLAEALLRPIGFYAIVGALLGYTVPYVIAHISAGLRPGAVLTMVGGTHVLSLAPPLSAIIFAATSGSAVNAWLGGLQLHGQVVALEGFGVSAPRYLWSPAWLALLVSYLVTIVTFILAMIGGGWVLMSSYDVHDPLAKLTSDFIDPKNDRLPFLWRGIFLGLSYAFGVASIVVWRGSAPKHRSEQVTASMTSAVMISTLYVVALELASLAFVFAATGASAGAQAP